MKFSMIKLDERSLDSLNFIKLDLDQISNSIKYFEYLKEKSKDLEYFDKRDLEKLDEIANDGTTMDLLKTLVNNFNKIGDILESNFKAKDKFLLALERDEKIENLFKD